MPLREVAFVHGALGDRDQPFEYLDRAFEEEPASLYFLEVDPMAAPTSRRSSLGRTAPEARCEVVAPTW